jgi:phage-related tail protein
MSSKSNKLCLTKLYKNEHIRNLIWDILTEDFDDTFERIIKELKELQSSLVETAKSNREAIKEKFIEFGSKLETPSDLKKILDDLSVWEENDCENQTDYN